MDELELNNISISSKKVSSAPRSIQYFIRVVFDQVTFRDTFDQIARESSTVPPSLSRHASTSEWNSQANQSLTSSHRPPAANELTSGQ